MPAFAGMTTVVVADSPSLPLLGAQSRNTLSHPDDSRCRHLGAGNLLDWPAGHDPSSTRMRWPSRKLTISCSRDTCSAKAGDASADSATISAPMMRYMTLRLAGIGVSRGRENFAG